ncbi:MAG: tetratricopeptide repeat protein, partial [Gemmatimonadetes bacterium]|nr:tetratricopeptide repeat protein [Gemmatimonadota bacterium]
IEAEREAGWMEAFQEGVELMDQQQYDQALTVLESSELLYGKRPEALLNIGSIYANRNDLDKAEEAFMKAAAAAEGPLVAQLDSASQVSWQRYAEMSKLNVAQLRGTRGVDAFGADDFDAAAEWFRKAVEINPHSRDYLFNYVQARYARASKLEEQIEATPADAATITPELVSLYAAIREDVEKVRAFDPTSEHLMLILVRAQRRHGELTGDTVGGREAALATLTRIEEMPHEVVELSIQPEESTATVTGKVKNRKAGAGTPVTLKITLLGATGQSIGEITLTVNVGETDSLTPFQQTTEITGQVAGWKYEVT